MAKQRRIKNPVARCMTQVTQATTHKDKKNDYKRKSKHAKRSQDLFHYVFNLVSSLPNFDQSLSTNQSSYRPVQTMPEL